MYITRVCLEGNTLARGNLKLSDTVDCHRGIGTLIYYQENRDKCIRYAVNSLVTHDFSNNYFRLAILSKKAYGLVWAIKLYEDEPSLVKLFLTNKN